ncbi:hypothetical protein WUBG_13123 [Wuchereria bancrofti]|uniref:Uncharacterized protein n=1 Tax=Wuchereria bancrofti TaxID=6293 RepID=J9EKT8_WUCBA|nr:hypothetical protein WUBG_13123 [Wuchereria bancrofti]
MCFCDKSISHLVNFNHAYSAEQPIQRRHVNMRQKRGRGVSMKSRGRVTSRR